jgi:hypothetical protein
MSKLSEMQPEESLLIIALPYKVGVWMSHTDDVEGELDDEREMKALEHILKSIAQVHESSNFVQEVARNTLKSREHWDIWANQSFDILGDCEKAVGLLKSHVNDNDLKDYKSTLMEIATIVAQAHGEFGEFEDDEDEGLGALIGKLVTKVSGASKNDADHPMNVSPAEDSALSRLAMALKIKE